jgi:hypothetical protein
MKERIEEMKVDVFNSIVWTDLDDGATALDIDSTTENLRAKGYCKQSENVIELPCKFGTHLWKITYPYRQEPKVTEFVVKNFKTVGKRHKVQIEVQAVNVPATSWMYYTAFYTTKEEAQNVLVKMKGGAE